MVKTIFFYRHLAKSSTHFFITNTFIWATPDRNWQKNQATPTLTLIFCYLKIICYFHPRYHPKVIGDTLINVNKCIVLMRLYLCRNNNEKVAENEKEIAWLHRHDIIRRMPRHGHKYTKYKMCLTLMMVICIKQQLSNIWSSINEKVK